MADEARGLAKAEPLDLRLERFQFLAVASERQRDAFAVGMQPRDRVDQEVGALDGPELTDIDDIGGVVGSGDGIKLRRGHAIENTAHPPAWRADGALIGVAGDTG